MQLRAIALNCITPRSKKPKGAITRETQLVGKLITQRALSKQKKRSKLIFAYSSKVRLMESCPLLINS